MKETSQITNSSDVSLFHTQTIQTDLSLHKVRDLRSGVLWIHVFWDVTLCSWVRVPQCFEEIYFLDFKKAL